MLSISVVNTVEYGFPKKKQSSTGISSQRVQNVADD